MIVDDFCLKETIVFWLPLSEFHLCRRSCSCILQPNYFVYNQTNSLSFTFIPREQSEEAQWYSCDEKASSYSATRWSSLRSKSTRHYPATLYFEKESFAGFDVILRFSYCMCLAAVTTQITAWGAKQTRLAIRSSKRKAIARSISCPLDDYSFSITTAGCTWTSVKRHWTEKSEKPPSKS